MGTKTWAAVSISLILLQVNRTLCQNRIPPWVTTQSVPLQGQTYIHLPSSKAVPYPACYTIRNNAVNDLPYQVDMGNANVVTLSCSDILRLGLPSNIIVDDFTVSSDLFTEVLRCKPNEMFVELSNGILLSYDLLCDQINCDNPKIAVPPLPILPDVDFEALVSGDVVPAKVKPIPILQKPNPPSPLVPTQVGSQPPSVPVFETIPVTSPYPPPQFAQYEPSPCPPQTGLSQPRPTVYPCAQTPCQPEPCPQPLPCPPQPCPPVFPCAPARCQPGIPCAPTPCQPEPCPQPLPCPPQPCPPVLPCAPAPCQPGFPCAPTLCQPEPCPQPLPSPPQPCPPVFPCAPAPCQPVFPCAPTPCPPDSCPQPLPCPSQPCPSVSSCAQAPCQPEPCPQPLPCPTQPCPTVFSCAPTPCKPEPCYLPVSPPCSSQSYLSQPCPPLPCETEPYPLPIFSPSLPQSCLPEPPCLPAPCQPEPCSSLSPSYPPQLRYPTPCPSVQPYSARCEQEPISLWDHFMHPPISCTPTPAPFSCRNDCGLMSSPCQGPFSIYSNMHPSFTSSAYNCPFGGQFYPNVLYA